ncbi:MAG: methionine--tRNA ligase [Sebaldella sp.]|nr:methionine--tRNA ligase [Sebaldella sp.]
MSKKFYITTPIYYPNAKPHVGTAYTTIVADVVARYMRLKDYDVSFLTGVDEHGQKIQEAAERNMLTPQEWVDKMALNFTTLWKKLNISNTDFMRTTEERHKISVKKMIKKVYENGDIYKGEYEGLYCVSDEAFIPDNSVVDGNKCPHCGKELITVKESSYFFKLSEYGEKLTKYIEENPNFIMPGYRKNEVLSFIKQGLQDLSISRTTFNWGIPLELEEGHVIYVWFDALTNYITAAGFGSDEKRFEDVWVDGKVMHLIGKDILRFHAIIWPAMLMSAGIPLPDTIAAHGWWTVEGEKMSKSKGNVIDPLEEVEKYGLDSFRYYLMREATFGLDGDYSQRAMVQRINADLANDLGNLLNRTIGMQKKYFDSKVVLDIKSEEIDEEIKKIWNETLKETDVFFEKVQFSEVLKSIWKFISRMNKYIDETAPWTLAKDPESRNRLSTVMYNLVESLYKIAVLISPFMPETGQKIWDQLGIKNDITKAKLEDIKTWGNYPANNLLEEAVPIFPRVEFEEPEKEEETSFDENLVIEKPITIDDFSKVEIKVVEIINVMKIDGADKLLKFIVDTGKEKRQIISGIAKYYPNIEELIGKKVLAVTNLEPVKLRGELSQGMLLTTEEKKRLKLIEIDKEVKIGADIK